MSTRNTALDVLRGGAVALMILVNNPGSWSQLYPPFAHAAWHGVTPTDLVFPFFLFAVGNALAFTMPALREAAPGVFWAKVAKRTLLIFAIGLFLNWSPFVRWDAAGELVARPFETLRLMGVLQRIALCWGAAAVIVWAWGERGAWWAAAVLLLAYWWACVALAQGPDAYAIEGFFGTALDRSLLGAAHLYKGEGVPFDPEGLASTLPAIAQVLLGYLAGAAVRRAKVDSALVVRLFVSACAALAVAYLWQLVMPLNKKLWTSSYVLHTTGLALMLLALLMVAIDLRGLRDGQSRRAAWVGFFEVFGKNALFVFVLSGFVPRVLGLLRWSDGVDAAGVAKFISPLPWVYREVFTPLSVLGGGDLRVGSLLFAVANLSLYWALARWLDHKRIYIRV
jgi:predicted acyltransferase